jgi:hypothetical protein
LSVVVHTSEVCVECCSAHESKSYVVGALNVALEFDVPNVENVIAVSVCVCVCVVVVDLTCIRHALR